MNHIAIIGRLTKDPQVRQTQGGTACTTFSVAVRRRFKNSAGNYDSDFFDCVAWRATAEYVAKYLKKGQRVAVEGSLQTRQYTAQDGSTRRVVEIVVESVEGLQDAPQTQNAAPAQIPEGFTEEIDPELPF